MGANLSVGQEHVLCFGDLCCQMRLETNFKPTGGSKGTLNFQTLSLLLFLQKVDWSSDRAVKQKKTQTQTL